MMAAGFLSRYVGTRLVASLLVVVGLCGFGGAAGAAGAAVISPSVEGSLTADEQAKLRAVVDLTLRQQRYTLVPASDVTNMIAAEPKLAACQTAACLGRLGELLDSRIVLTYQLEPLPAGAGWLVAVELLDVEVGAVGATLSQNCASGQLERSLGDLVKRAVLATAERTRGVLEIESTPASAAVFVDGTELGLTPYRRAAFAGKHKLVLRHFGYRSEQVEAVVSATPGQPVRVRMVQGDDPVKVVTIVREKAAPIYKKWWFWVALGGAAAAASAVAVGVVVGTRGAASDQALPANTYMFMF